MRSGSSPGGSTPTASACWCRCATRSRTAGRSTGSRRSTLAPLSEAASVALLGRGRAGATRRPRPRSAPGRRAWEPARARRVRSGAVARPARRGRAAPRAARRRPEARTALPPPGRRASACDPAAPARRGGRADRRRRLDLACRTRARLRRARDRARAGSWAARGRATDRVPPPAHPLGRVPRRQSRRSVSGPRGAGRRDRRRARP